MKKSRSDQIFDIINILFMLVIIIIMLYPLCFVVIASFSEPYDVAKGNVTLLPSGFTLDAYKNVFKEPQIWIGYRNTIFYTILGTAWNLITLIPAAYVMSKKKLSGRTFLSWFFFITMYFGGGMVPTYLLMMKMNLINNPLVIIIPGCVSAYNVFVFRTFFRNIPEELGESAKIDGANEFTILFRIILPTSKALLATFGLFAIVGMWNNWFGPMIYFKNPNLYPVQNILREYLYVIDTANLQQRAGSGVGNFNPTFIQQISPKGVRMAIVVVTMFPIMCIYPFFQKYFTKGMLVGSVKG